MKSQIELAKGDRVKVVRKYTGGVWGKWWLSAMDEYIGKEGIVEYFSVGEDGQVMLEGFEYGLPVQSIEKVEEITLPEVPSWDADRVHVSVHMTKREYFAAMAMQGCIMNTGNVDAAWCVRAADALIAELNKGEG